MKQVVQVKSQRNQKQQDSSDKLRCNIVNICTLPSDSIGCNQVKQTHSKPIQKTSQDITHITDDASTKAQYEDSNKLYNYVKSLEIEFLKPSPKIEQSLSEIKSNFREEQQEYSQGIQKQSVRDTPANGSYLHKQENFWLRQQMILINTEHQQKIQDLITTVNSLKQENLKKTQEVKLYAATIAEQTLKLVNSDLVIDQLTTQTKRLEGELIIYQQQEDLVAKEIIVNRKKIETLLSQLQQIEQKLQTTQEVNQTISQKLLIKDEESLSFQKQISESKQQKLMSEQKDVEMFNLQGTLTSLQQQQKKELESQKNYYEYKMSQPSEHLQQLQSDNIVLKQRNNDLQLSYQTLQTDYNIIKSQFSAEAQSKQDNVNQIKLANQNHQQKVNEMNSSINQLMIQVQQLSGSLNFVKEQLLSAQNSIISRDCQINQLSMLENENYQQIVKQQLLIQQQQQQILVFQIKLEESTQLNLNLQQQLIKSENKNDTLRLQILDTSQFRLKEFQLLQEIKRLKDQHQQ